MIHLLTMTCTIRKRTAGGTSSTYHQPVYSKTDMAGVRCLYLTASDQVVAEERARGNDVTGKLYVTASVDIQDGYRVKTVARNGATIDAGEFEVVRVKDELCPSGLHHRVAFLKRAEATQ